jgi:hypothetical protein
MAKTFPRGFGHLRAKVDASAQSARTGGADRHAHASLTTSPQANEVIRWPHADPLTVALFDKLRASTAGGWSFEFSMSKRCGVACGQYNIYLYTCQEQDKAREDCR